MTGEEDVLRILSARLGDSVSDLRVDHPRRLGARVDPERAKEVLRTLREEFGYDHLSAISGVDTGSALGLVYHLSVPGGIVLSMETAVPREDPRLPSVTDLFPAANLYEREVHDLFGITFDGHPDPRPLLLYEGWPEGAYPLRKDWKPSGADGDAGS